MQVRYTTPYLQSTNAFPLLKRLIASLGSYYEIVIIEVDSSERKSICV